RRARPRHRLALPRRPLLRQPGGQPDARRAWGVGQARKDDPGQRRGKLARDFVRATARLTAGTSFGARDTARAMSQENVEIVRRIYEKWEDLVLADPDDKSFDDFFDSAIEVDNS